MVEEFKNEKQTDNHVGVVDNIGVAMLKEQKANHEQELKTLQGALDDAQKTHDNFKEQWDVHEAKVQLQLDNWGMLDEKKTHRFHLLPEYWELEKKLFQYQFRMDKSNNEGMIKQFLNDIDSYKKQMDIAQKNLDEVTTRLIGDEQ